VDNKKNIVIVKDPQQIGAKIGLLSRIDYGSEGFRKYLITDAFKGLEMLGTHFNILITGLVSRDFGKTMKARIKEIIEKEKLEEKRYPRFGEELSIAEQRACRKEELIKQYLLRAAKELAEIIPKIQIEDPNNLKIKKSVDLFIVTSPAYDGEDGEQIAVILEKLRTDIRVWNKGAARFPVYVVDKKIQALAPKKAIWMRSDYYSTPIERVIKDYLKQTTRDDADIIIVGGFCSAIYKPKGELLYRYVSLPGLHRIEETRINENQIGYAVLNFSNKEDDGAITFYDLKDLVSQELSFIVPPMRCSLLQKDIIETIKKEWYVTPGYLSKTYGVSEEIIIKALTGLCKKKTFTRKQENWPSIVEKSGKQFAFDLSYVQNKLKCSLEKEQWVEERIYSICCLHAGSINTDYEYFVNETPKIILQNKATILVNAGDTIEGLAHKLAEQGEVVAGMNNHTVQERFAAYLIGEVIVRVFKERFKNLFSLLSEEEKKNVSPEKLSLLVSNALLKYYYILGNHDLWQGRDAYEPLSVFHLTLEGFILKQVNNVLAEHNLSCNNPGAIVSEHLKRTETFNLSSGLKVGIQHPHMSRSKTTSLRLQGMLQFASNCQIVIGGNFHVAETLLEWENKLGERVCQEIGTMKHHSSFEDHKLKTVDHGGGLLIVRSSGQRIRSVSTSFFGAPKKESIDNLILTNNFMQLLGISILDL